MLFLKKYRFIVFNTMRHPAPPCNEGHNHMEGMSHRHVLHTWFLWEHLQCIFRSQYRSTYNFQANRTWTRYSLQPDDFQYAASYDGLSQYVGWELRKYFVLSVKCSIAYDILCSNSATTNKLVLLISRTSPLGDLRTRCSTDQSKAGTGSSVTARGTNPSAGSSYSVNLTG